MTIPVTPNVIMLIVQRFRATIYSYWRVRKFQHFYVLSNLQVGQVLRDFNSILNLKF